MRLRHMQWARRAFLFGSFWGLLAGAAFGQSLSPLATRLGMDGTAGFDVSGPAHIVLNGGTVPAHFHLLVWGAHYRRLTIQIPGQGIYQLTVNGKSAQVQRPVSFPPLPGPNGPGDFGILLPQSSLLADVPSGQAAAETSAPSPAASGAVTAIRIAAGNSSGSAHSHDMEAGLDASTGLPAYISRKDRRGREIRAAYSRYTQASGVQYPTHMEESMDGKLTLVLDITHFEVRQGITASNFAVATRGSH